ncbi:hypothetical protein C8J57DRAFT_1229666 [Mycena rebaudengoi]|nr:hypothetical protein C8J57DRAFT_1229666 [Mycena rebaudengoi]
MEDETHEGSRKIRIRGGLAHEALLLQLGVVSSLAATTVAVLDLTGLSASVLRADGINSWWQEERSGHVNFTGVEWSCLALASRYAQYRADISLPPAAVEALAKIPCRTLESNLQLRVPIRNSIELEKKKSYRLRSKARLRPCHTGIRPVYAMCRHLKTSGSRIGADIPPHPASEKRGG